MNLPQHYAAMRAAAARQLLRGQAELDPLLDDARDSRRGLTVLARPPAAVTAVVGQLLAEFRQLEPEQYYYPASDLHLTVLSVISCVPGFTLEEINPADYQRIVREVARESRPFRIRLAGLTASAGGILVQGFPEDEGLAALRDTLRAAILAAPLRQSIDQRYRLETAHSTIIRFRRPLRNPAALLAKLREYERYFIGAFEVPAVELVYNDWYQRAANTGLLGRYELSGR
ncbi:2'-5' RNA ligase family protein [Hymenobacter persicinus]|uniref:Mutarotase n=1 Tax=Hymenobacter persicinus TaxID=2025506 RepID=A0A4Q5L8W8_9BACT|nr:2'-5' RNA ligase family protein [Hymenobacter persicinus]RYU78152.1 mutarotase [Hymenobacter persicinus]